MCQTGSCESVQGTEIDACWALPFCAVTFLHPASRDSRVRQSNANGSSVRGPGKTHMSGTICRWQRYARQSHRQSPDMARTVEHLRRALAGGRSLPWSHADRASDVRSRDTKSAGTDRRLSTHSSLQLPDSLSAYLRVASHTTSTLLASSVWRDRKSAQARETP